MNVLIFGNGYVSRDLDLARRVDETNEFDKVIRMNECKLVAYHDKIGWRTDIYTFCGRSIMVDFMRNTKEIWWGLGKKRMDWMLSDENPTNCKVGYDLLSREGVVHTHFHKLPEASKRRHLGQIQELNQTVQAPKSISCGIRMILLCELFLPAGYNLHLAGYDGAKTGHLWDERDMHGLSASQGKAHNFKGEYEWLEGQESAGNLSIIRNK